MPCFQDLLYRHRGETPKPHGRSRDEVQAIKFTGGSTGVPKGVPLSHAGAIWCSEHRLKLTGSIDVLRM